MGVSLKQPSFGGGVVSAQLLGRTDQNHYATGLRTLTNAWVTRYGTVENRPGTLYVCEVADDERVRLIRFGSSIVQGLLLVFGDMTLRFIKNGAPIPYSTPLGAWAGGTTYTHGVTVTYSGTVYYSLQAGNIGHQPDVSPTWWYAQPASGVLEIPTIIPAAALASFQVVQINDLMFIVDHLFYPQELTHYGDDDWTIAQFVAGPGISPPTNVTVTMGFPSSAISPPAAVTATGGDALGTAPTYKVTSFGFSPSEESEGSGGALATVGAPTVADPVTVAWSAAAGIHGYVIYRSRTGSDPFGIIGVTQDLTFLDEGQEGAAQGATPVKVMPVGDSAKTFTYVVTSISAATGVESLASAQATGQGNTPSSAHPNIITWTTNADAQSYNVYKSTNGVFGFIGNSVTNQFKDINFEADTAQQPPVDIPLFQTSDDYPSVIGTYQQRLLFANTINEPQTVWCSVVGDFTNFTTSIPVLDSGAIQFTIFGRIRQYVQALVDLGKLIIHTNNGEYVCNGNQAGTLTPSSITLVLTGSAGSAAIVPVVVGNTDLFVQEGATRLLDLRYEVQSFSYAGKDLTKYATDLFRGRTIVSMDWQKFPHSIVWCVLDNGQMVGQTYVREDELWAWHLHESDNGSIENVCVITEAARTVVYLVVKRTINGVVVRYIESMAPRDIIDTVNFDDSVFADSALIYDGRNTTGTTITATSAGGWTTTDVLTLTGSAASFTPALVGDQVVFQQFDDTTGLVSDEVWFQVLAYTSTTVVTVKPLRLVPTWARGIALTSWGLAVTSYSGIDHLEGEALAVLADGDVVGSPLDPAYTPQIIVSGGAFTLTNPAMVVVAGLPIQMDIETLPVENATGETVANKHIQIRECTPIFYVSRGGQFGQDFAHLKTWKAPLDPLTGAPALPVTGPYRIPIQGSSQRTGQVAIRNVDPVPWSMSAIVLSGEVANG